MNHRPVWKTQNYKTPKDNVGENIDDLEFISDFRYKKHDPWTKNKW